MKGKPVANRVGTVQYYRDGAGDWRWTLVDSANGRIVGASTEGFRKRSAAQHNFKLNNGFFNIVEVVL